MKSYSVIAAIIFVYGCVAISKKTNQEDENIEGLKAAADFIRSTMNFQANPCEDFHEFKCGKIRELKEREYPDAESYSPGSVASTNFTRRLANLLDDFDPRKTSMPEIFKKVKIIYNKCINRADDESISSSIEHAMDAVQSLGGSPMFYSKWKRSSSRSILSYALEANKRFGVTFGISLSPEEDEASGKIHLKMELELYRLPLAQEIARLHRGFALLSGRSIVRNKKHSRSKKRRWKS